MANDNEANFAKIGVFILAGVALIAGTLVYLGGAGGEKREYLVETYFSNDVSGLDVGSAVNFRGVRVGAVKDISFIGAEYDNVSPQHARNIYVLMALDSKLCRMTADDSPVRFVKRLLEQGLHATVTASGITGLSRIEMNFPKTEVVDEKISWHPRHLLIPPAPSILESATESAAKILRQLNKMDFVSVWSNVVRLTSNAAEMCESANGLIESQRGHISETLHNLDGAVSSLRTFAESISDNPSLLIRPRDAEPLKETSW
jgi:hypothetical protein